MKKSIFLILAFVSVSLCFAQEKGKSIQEYLAEEYPYEFVSRMNSESQQTEWLNSRSEYLVSGVDIWFKPHWWHLPTAFYYGVLKVDEIHDNNIYVSFRCNSAKENDFFDYDVFNGEPATLLGRLSAGDYVIILSAVDEAGEFSATSLEIPFTVKDNPVSVPCGLVHVSGDNSHIRGKEIVDLSNYSPDFTITAEGDSLHVVGWLNYTCCMDHYCYYEIYGDSVYIETVQAGYYEECDCRGAHFVDFKIGPYRNEESLCTVSTWEYFVGAHTLRLNTTSVDFSKTDNKLILASPFDLQGRQVATPSKGIYIKKGKKVLVK